MLKAWSLILFSYFICFKSYSYLIMRSDAGQFSKWNSSSNINFFLTNTVEGISSAEVDSIVFSSISSYNSQISNSVNLLISNDGQVSGRNDIYQLENDVFFSDNSIVAVTTTHTDSVTGKIVEADIALSSSYSFSNSAYNKNYLGNAMTHEIGHALGLDHSQLRDATMFFETKKGQYSLHSDDISGLKMLYGETSLGNISGVVAGGSSLVSVFGAHVTAFSQSTGKAVASTVSDDSGSFIISNLPLDDTYFIYVEPINEIGLKTQYYNVVKKNYCDNGNSYKGGFFQRCFGDDRGKPYGISLSSSQSSINMGYVSIKCGLEVSREYMISKGDTFTPQIVTKDTNSTFVGSSHVGFFNAKSINGALVFDDLYDDYNIDLSLYDLHGDFPGKDLYLEVRIATQPFYSPLRVTTILNHEDFLAPVYEPFLASSLPVDSDGKYDLSVTHRLPISTVQLKNIYSLKIVPSNIDQVHSMDENHPLSYEVFSLSRSGFNEDRHFYFITTRLVEKVGIDYKQVSQKNFGTLTDNSSCMDGAQTYSVTANTISNGDNLKATKKKTDDSALPIACGSIVDINSGPPGGGPSASLFTLLFMMIFLLKVRSSRILE